MVKLLYVHQFYLPILYYLVVRDDWVRLARLAVEDQPTTVLGFAVHFTSMGRGRSPHPRVLIATSKLRA